VQSSAVLSGMISEGMFSWGATKVRVDEHLGFVCV
jgi:hypothetical protein